MRWSLIGLLFAMGIAASAGQGQASATREDATTLTIHRWLCPLDHANESNSACLANPLRGGVFIVDGPESRVGMTDPNGTLSFSGLGTGEYQIQVLPYGEAHLPPRAFCGAPGAASRTALAWVGRDAFRLNLVGETVCDWYEFPVSREAAQVASLGVPIVAYRCGSDPGGIGVAMTEYPDGCAGMPGVEVLIEADDGSWRRDCVTDPGGRCDGRGVPEFATLTVNEATLPAGIVPKANPVSVWFYTEFASAHLIHLPVGVDVLSQEQLEAGARPRTRIEIVATVCHDGFAFEDGLDACAGRPGNDFRFEVWQAENPGTMDGFDPYAAKRKDGTTSFNTIGYGEGSLRIIGASPRAEPEGYAVVDVRCTRAGDGVVLDAVRLPHEPGTTVAVREVAFRPGDDLRCDWYVVVG